MIGKTPKGKKNGMATWSACTRSSGYRDNLYKFVELKWTQRTDDLLQTLIYLSSSNAALISRPALDIIYLFFF
jgi:hypothetical protein